MFASKEGVIIMKNKTKLFGTLLGVCLISLLSLCVLADRAAAGPTLESATFYGGSGDQRGTAIAVSGGAVYLSGNIQPENYMSSSSNALVLKYALPPGPSPVWLKVFDYGTHFSGIAATNEGVYAGGANYSLSWDGVGGKETKSIAAKFRLDGIPDAGPGGSIWVNTPNFFAYTGAELHYGLTSALEGGSPVIYAAGGGQPCSYSAYIVAKYNTSGTLLAKATDSSVGINFSSCWLPSPGSSNSFGVTTLNGYTYAVGDTNWSHEGDSPQYRPAIWKYDSNLNLIWRRKDSSLSGYFGGTTAYGNAIYAVGFKYTATIPDYLIEKYDEAGNLLWSKTSGGLNTDFLTGVVGVGSRLFAVGYTMSAGAGGTDAVIMEIDPSTGNTLSTTLFGGAQNDMANGAATDGTDLYVVGESMSFASSSGNTVGQNDVMLLRYSIEPACVANAGPDQIVDQTQPEGAYATLNGSGSTGGALTYNWTWAGGSAVGAGPEVLLPAGTTTVTLTVTAGSCTSTDTVDITVQDTTPPSTTDALIGTPGDNGWYVSNVTVILSAADSGSGVKEIRYVVDGGAEQIILAGTASIGLTSDGIHTVSYYAVDNAGNTENQNSRTVKIDKTPPEITINVPVNGGVYILSQVVNADWSTTDALSGLASSTGTVLSGAAINTASVGAKNFNVTATDHAGNPSSLTHNYSVVYDFAGFFQPVDNSALNVAKGGGAIPVKFSLNGDQGLNIFASGYPGSQRINCDTASLEDAIEETVTAGSSSLSYDPVTGQYTYVWKTSKEWAGTCRQLTVRTNDGINHTANFKLK